LATVYKRNKTYWVRFQWRGTEVRRSAHTSSKAVAQKFLGELQAENERLDRGGRPRRTLKEAYARFLADYLPQLKPRTQDRYRTTMRIVLAAFGDIYLDQITRGRLSDFVTKRLQGGVVGATVRHDLATLSVLCSCAVAWEYLDLNPVQQFSKRHIKESRPRTGFPTLEQVELVIAKASPMAGRVIRLLSLTGMRLGEASTLEWPQVSIQRREIRLTKTKTSSPRVVPLSDAALATLIGTPRHITSPFVFWHHEGQPYTNFSGHFRGIAARAHFPFRCHDLRHYFASTFAQRVGDLPALQAILGHKGITMTMRYSHLMTEHLHAAMRKYSPTLNTDSGTTALVVAEEPDPAGDTIGPLISGHTVA
jgi:integrase/recombinase XerD